MTARLSLLRQAGPLAAAAWLAGCAVGPDFVRPEAPAVANYTPAPAPATRGADPAAGAISESAPGWWTRYQSSTLDAWVDEGLRNSPDLKSTTANLAAARELLSAQVGSSELPSIGAGAEYAHQRAIGLPGFGPPTSIYKVFGAVLDVSYDIDLFGGIRRSNEASRADVEAQGYEWQAARESLVANIVVRAIRSSALRAELDANERAVALARRQDELTQRLYQLGGVPHRDVLDAERAYHNAAAALPEMRAQWWRERHALAVLLGRAPVDAPQDIDFADFTPPKDVPVEVPSELVRVRPDVLAAEAGLHAASARVGVATANLLPKLTLTGSYGSESFTRREFMRSPTTVWSSVEGGALLAQKRASSAELDAAYERYRATVLRSFAEVADALRALEADDAQLAEREGAEQSALRFFKETQSRHRSGSETLLAEVASEAAWQSEHVERIAALEARLVDTASLCQAIGAPEPRLTPVETRD
jgi:NodT family efflux transporter outer membrane factor (OMF) lipoprotein